MKTIHSTSYLIDSDQNGVQIDYIKIFAKKIKYSESSILITGETGTGKSNTAKYIYEQSNYYKNKLVTIPLSEIPEELFESQLFGYIEGAFTDAKKSFEGLLKSAEGGTVVFEEIDTIPTYLQAKILRVIESKCFYQLGSSKLHKINVRFFFTSNRDLKNLIKNGQFRKDLFYRINVLRLDIKPLRQRKEDIMPLAHYFLKRIATSQNKVVDSFSKEAENRLISMTWDGNIRELNSEIERIVTFIDPKQEIVQLKDILIEIKENELLLEDVNSLSHCVGFNEKEHIINQLHKNKWHKGKTARDLNISRKTLYNKMKKYSLLKTKKLTHEKI